MQRGTPKSMNAEKRWRGCTVDRKMIYSAMQLSAATMDVPSPPSERPSDVCRRADDVRVNTEVLTFGNIHSTVAIACAD